MGAALSYKWISVTHPICCCAEDIQLDSWTVVAITIISIGQDISGSNVNIVYATPVMKKPFDVAKYSTDGSRLKCHEYTPSVLSGTQKSLSMRKKSFQLETTCTFT